MERLLSLIPAAIRPGRDKHFQDIHDATTKRLESMNQRLDEMYVRLSMDGERKWFLCDAEGVSITAHPHDEIIDDDGLLNNLM